MDTPDLQPSASFPPAQPSRGSGWLVRSILAAAAALVALTWIGTVLAVRAEREQAELRIAADAANQALAFSSEVERQLLALDQSLRIVEAEWEEDPAKFDLASWQQRLTSLNGLVRQVFVADAGGHVVASSRPEAIGTDVSQEDFFTFHARPPENQHQSFTGPVVRATSGDQWQINMTRRLDAKNGSFAGVIGLSYTTNALRRYFAEADLGPDGMVALVGADGVVRSMVGPRSVDPGADISQTPMFTALQKLAGEGRWTGVTPPDGRTRIVAFRPVRSHDLFVLIGLDAEHARQPAAAWASEAEVFGALISLLISLMAFGMLREVDRARRREASLDHDRSVLAAANFDLAAARARADLKSALLETTISGMSDGLSVLDPELYLVQWNDRFAEYMTAPSAPLDTGMTFEAILRAQLDARHLDPDEAARELATQLAPLRSGAEPQTLELVRHDGRIIELRHRALPGGGFVTLTADITTRKETEAALNRAREAAEQAVEAKSRFVAIVSHEIRTPLNTLIGSLTLLSGSDLDGEQTELVEIAEQSGTALLGLINDILEMTTLEAGHLSLRPSAFPLRPVLDGVAEMFRHSAIERGLILSVDVAPGSPAQLQADPGRLRQVLLNLVSNAVKFAEPGRIVLRAEPAALDSGGSGLRLSVRDPGPSLSAQDRASLFQPFTRLDRSNAISMPGTGLGLSICRRLTQLMGGQIGCQATEEEGNEFWFVIPIDQPQSERVGGTTIAAAPVNVPPAKPPSRCRILLVEDVGPSQVVMAALLRRQGYDVHAAGSGADAVEAARTGAFDIVLLDLLMPGMSGFDAAAAIRELPGRAGRIPIVALTASAFDEDRARCLLVGMNDLLSKPAPLPALLDALGRNLLAAGLTAAPADAPRPVGGQGAPILDAARFRDLREHLPHSVLIQIAEDGLDDLYARLAELGAAVGARDGVHIEAVAHAMVSVAGGCGLAALEAQLRVVIEAAHCGDLAICETAHGALIDEIDQGARAIREALRSEPA